MNFASNSDPPSLVPVAIDDSSYYSLSVLKKSIRIKKNSLIR